MSKSRSSQAWNIDCARAALSAIRQKVLVLAKGRRLRRPSEGSRGCRRVASRPGVEERRLGRREVVAGMIKASGPCDRASGTFPPPSCSASASVMHISMSRPRRAGNPVTASTAKATEQGATRGRWPRRNWRLRRLRYASFVHFLVAIRMRRRERRRGGTVPLRSRPGPPTTSVPAPARSRGTVAQEGRRRAAQRLGVNTVSSASWPSCVPCS